MDFRLVIFLVIAARKANSVTVPKTSPDTWRQLAQKEIEEGLKMKQNTNVAKNVILLLGDGMGVSTVTAARIYKGQLEGKSGEETVLSFEKFPNIALSKTYNVDRQTADSAGTATAFLCGVKANWGTVGLAESVNWFDCDAQESGKVTSILKWSLDEGKSVGFVTNTRVTHATPASGYAHSANRYWEGERDIAKQNLTGKCRDIAQQLVDNFEMQVILGGGRRYFVLNNETDPVTGKASSHHRADGRDVIKDWKAARSAGGKKAHYVYNKEQFDQVDAVNTDYLLGLFSESHMTYEIDRDRTKEPSLAEMTKKAIEILQKNKKGFFLLVEGGRIDHAHHFNNAKKALHEVVSFNEAVDEALKMTSVQDTLLVVTADHSHVFSVGGHPSRGNDILGTIDEASYASWDKATDNMPKTTLVYANGPGNLRENLTLIDTTDVNYKFPTAVQQEEESHGGEDVAVYAQGPMAHLFYGVHEQSYLAHVMAYASCVGANKKHCDKTDTAGASSLNIMNSFFVLGSLLIQTMLVCLMQ